MGDIILSVLERNINRLRKCHLLQIVNSNTDARYACYFLCKLVLHIIDLSSVKLLTA